MKSNGSIVSKSTVVLLVSAVMAAVLLITLLLIGTQTVAWFKSFDVVENDAALSNFVTLVEYSFNATEEQPVWESVSDGEAIPVTPDKLDDLSIRVNYQSAHHTAYARVSVFGSFYNIHTGTYLPQEEPFWSFVEYDNSWTLSDSYLYYNQKLETTGESDTLTLSPFSVQATFPESVSEHQDYQGDLYVIVDAVQPDRYPVFWTTTTAITTTATTIAPTTISTTAQSPTTTDETTQPTATA